MAQARHRRERLGALLADGGDGTTTWTIRAPLGLAPVGLGQRVGGDAPATALLFVCAPLWMILLAPAIFAALDRREQSSHLVGERFHAQE